MSTHRIEQTNKYFNEDGVNIDADLEVNIIARRITKEEMVRQQGIDVVAMSEKNKG